MRCILPVLVVAAIMAPCARAALPAVPDVPNALPTEIKATLAADRTAIEAQKQALIEEGMAINRDCARVEENSAQYHSCLQRKAGFGNHLAALRTAVAGFSQRLDTAVSTEIQRLNARDRELTQAIDRDLTAIRRLGFNRRAEDFAEWEKLGVDAQRRLENEVRDQAVGIAVSQAQDTMLGVFKKMGNARLRRLIALLEKHNAPEDKPVLEALRAMLTAGKSGRAHMAKQASIINAGIERGLQGARVENREDELRFWADFVCDAAGAVEFSKPCHWFESEGLVVSAALYNNAARRVAVSEVNRLTTLTEAELHALKKIDALLVRHVKERKQVRESLQALQQG